MLDTVDNPGRESAEPVGAQNRNGAAESRKSASPTDALNDPRYANLTAVVLSPEEAEGLRRILQNPRQPTAALRQAMRERGASGKTANEI
jgi:hypothetical protein